MKPVNIQIQNTNVFEGITVRPVICWQYGKKDAGTFQKACRIELRKNRQEVIIDTGRIETGRQNNHELNVFLDTHCWYDVKVTVWDEHGIEDSSVSSRYLSGIDERISWPAKWIGSGQKTPFQCFYSFNAESNLAGTYLSVAGTGQYECRVNGMLPDDSVLNGSWTDFHKRIHYRTFDITHLIKKGNNCISIEVGNGWYLGYSDQDRYFYTLGQGYETFGDCLGATAVITLVYQDGKRKTVLSDSNWKIAESPVVYTNIYGSEDYDARKEQRPWENVDTASLQNAVELGERVSNGKLTPALYPPVKVLNTYEGRHAFTTREGALIYDLGQNIAGFIEVAVQGLEGDQVKIFTAESWEMGTDFAPTTNSWCTYTLKHDSGVQKFHSKFTYQAGRYVCISVTGNANLRIVSVRGYFIGSSAKETGHFTCSDDQYLQVYNLIERAIESNLNHVHTDCPTFERLGWQEPNHLMGPSIMYLKDVNNLWDKIEQDQCDSQYEPDEYDIDKGEFPHRYGPGLLTSIAPRYARFTRDYGSGSFWDIIPWGSSLLMGAYERSRFYGDISGYLKYYDNMKQYVEYQYQKYLCYEEIYCKQHDSINEETPVHFLRQGLGDWGIVQGYGDGRENIETAYLYRDLILLSEIAELLKRYDEKQKYSMYAKELCEEYNHFLLRQDSNTGFWYYHTFDPRDREYTQANQAIPLQFGMVPGEKRASVEAGLLRSVETNGIVSGEVGLPYIFRSLSEMGKMEAVEKMIFHEEHPSYYRFLTTGETTLPEFWRDDARSRNHDMMGSIIEWFYRYLAGISSEDGFSNILIRPRLTERLSFVECSYEAITGTIYVKASKTGEGNLLVICELPVNTQGVIQYNNTEYPVQGGIRYRLLL